MRRRRFIPREHSVVRADAGVLAPADGWLRVHLPKLSITRIEYPLIGWLRAPLALNNGR